MTELELDSSALTPWELEHGVMSYDAVNLTDRSVTQPEYEAMIEAVRRTDGPISWYPYQHDGHDGLWLVTGNSLAHEVLIHPDLFSSGEGVLMHDLPPEYQDVLDLMIMLDGPPHDEQRQIVERNFRKRAVQDSLGSFLATAAKELVDRAAEQATVDFVEEVATPLPLMAIAELLGIPEDQRQQIFSLGQDITMLDQPTGDKQNPAYQRQLAASFQLLTAAIKVFEQVESKEIDNEILGKLQAAVSNDTITPFQAQTFFILLFLAGNETTRNTLGNGAVEFAEHPEQWDLLRQNASLLDSAIAEVTRHTTAVRYIRRTAMSDVVLNDANIHKDDKVVVSLTGANHDPEVFDRPHAFNITRPQDRAIAFGFGGHYCLGRRVALAEMSAVFGAMTESVERIELVDPTERAPVLLINNVSRAVLRLVTS